MMIDEIIKDISTVNAMVREMATGEASVESANTLVAFYRRHSNTDLFIRQCVDAMRNGMDMRHYAISLKTSVDEFLSIVDQYSDALTDFDFKAMVERHLSPFKEAYNSAKTEATALWREFQSVSNRLDYMDERCSDYLHLRAECDDLEQRYNVSHEAVNQSYDALREREDKYAALYFFDFGYLLSLISVYTNIADSLIKDSENGG